MTDFDSGILREYLKYFTAFNIVDNSPNEVRKFIMKEFAGEDILYVSAADFTADIRKAIIENKRTEFYHKYISSKYLFFEAEDRLGDAAATTYITILCARKIDNLSTVFISRNPTSEYIPNESLNLNMFLHMSVSIRKDDTY